MLKKAVAPHRTTILICGYGSRVKPGTTGNLLHRLRVIQSHSRDMICPSFTFRSAPSLKRAQGKPGARCNRGPVCKSRKGNAHEHTGSAEALRLSLRDGLRLIRALPGEDRACLSPSSVGSIRFLRTFACHWGVGTTRFHRPPCALSSVARSASTASRRAFVTCARPSIGWDGQIHTLSCASDKAKYFYRGDLTGFW